MVRDDLEASIRAAVQRVAMRTMAASALDRMRPALGIPTGPMNVVPTCLLPPKVQEAVSALALQERSAVPVHHDTDDFIRDLYDAQLEVAIGLANNTVTPKMSKSLDMRFHWLQDRVRQGRFRIVFVPGLQNLADFFTKALPVSRHKSLAPFIAFDDGDKRQCRRKFSS
jgi:hypothetical protein